MTQTDGASNELVARIEFDTCYGVIAYAQDGTRRKVSSDEVLQALNGLSSARKALEFYRDGWNFKTNKNRVGLVWTPKEELLDDCGEIARAALQPEVKKCPE